MGRSRPESRSGRLIKTADDDCKNCICIKTIIILLNHDLTYNFLIVCICIANLNLRVIFIYFVTHTYL